MVELTGRCALVTGGARGIGAEAARLFEALGARVAVSDLGGRSTTEELISGDVSSERDAERIVATAADRLGGLDALVHCAGVVDVHTATVEQDLSAWQRIVDINLCGTYLVCRAAGRIMLERRRGSIVTVGSIVGLHGFPRANAYGASKAGVAAITRSLACEWADLGVRVNCIAPGFIDTPMVAEMQDDGALDAERVRRRTPMGRLGTPLEIARAAAFLASDRASFITGAVLCVDGGWSAFGGVGSAHSG